MDLEKNYGANLQQFDGTDYLVWSSLMEAVLTAKGLGQVLSVKPEGTDDDTWNKDDTKARAIILLSVNREIVKSIVHLRTSREIWTKLKQLHLQKSESNKIQLQQDFYNARMESGVKISEFVSRMEYITSQLKDFGEQISESALIAKIVSGLPTEYKHFMSAWLGTAESERTFDKLLSRLLAEEAILKETESKESVALNVRIDKTSKGKSDKKRDKKNIECYHCHKKGHYKRDCRQRKRDEQDSEKKEVNTRFNNPSRGRALTARLLSAEALSQADSQSWCLDTGASRHMTMNRHWLDNYKDFKEPVPVRVGNKEVIYGIGSGTIDAISYVGKQQIEVTLYDVMLVPDLSDNLFSAGVADERGLTYRAGRGIIEFMDGNEVILRGVKQGSNLYKLGLKVTEYAKVSKSERSLEEWHEALGHPDIRQVQTMAKNSSVEGFKIVERPRLQGCGDCQLGKGHRCSHPDSHRDRATDILERVHVDLVGPIEPPSVSGYKYFMVVKDEYSSYRWVRFFCSKSHVLNAIRKFLNEVAVQTQKRVKIIRSDNGTEFKNQGIQVLCEFEGIIQEFSAPRTAQQNGEIERTNRTILETARTMFQATSLPLALWAEAVNSAVYVRNRIPNKRTGDVTPYELFHGRKPDVSNLVKFGQEVYILDHTKGISKFSAKTTEAHVVGYGERFNTYRCLMLNTSNIVITSDVVVAPHKVAPRDQQARARHWIIEIDDSLAERETEDWLVEEEVSHSRNFENIPAPNRIDIDEEINEQTRQRCTLEPPEMNNDVFERDSNIRGINSRAASQIPVPITSFAPQTVVSQNQRVVPVTQAPQSTRNATGEALSTVNDTRAPSGAQTTKATAKATVGSRQPTGARQKAPVDWTLKDRAPRSTKSVYAKKTFHAKVASIEPLNFTSAIESDNSNEWKAAIKAELDAHERNNTWKIVPKTRDLKEIQSKWLFKVKYDAAGKIDRFKARIVAKGFSQVKGVDYGEIYAPVVRMDSIRLLFSLCAQYNLVYKQFDITTAFLYGEIKEELYLTPPEGLNVPEGHTCRLLKSLYGLKQSPRCWNAKFAEMLRIFDMEQTTADPCVYVSKEDRVYLALYVDDGLIFAEDQKIIDRLIGYLTKYFEVKLVETSCFIGVEIAKEADGSILLHQRGYINRMLSKFDMLDCKAKHTPLEVGHSLNKPEVLKNEIVKNIPYAEAVGSLMYCALATRPDLALALSVLSKFNSCPRQQHWLAIKRVFRYLKGTPNHGLIYQKVAKPKLVCFTDADWAGDHENRKSLSGMVSFITSGPISYKSQQQNSVALSTTESEYVAASIACSELIWLQKFIKELRVPLDSKPLLLCDNQSAIKLTKNPEFHQRTKHIDIRYHSIRERYLEGYFEPQYVATEDQKADIFTKPLTTDKFSRLRDLIGCTDTHIKNSEKI